MQTTITKLPDITEYNKYIMSIPLSSDITVLAIFKQLFRSDDVIIDIYLNEIANETKILGGKKLVPDALLCLPKSDLGFNYNVYCSDIDGVNTGIVKNNVYKFYFQFTTQEGEDWS